MSRPERELLILLPQGRWNDTALEREVLFLHRVLGITETMDTYVAAVDVLEMNRGGRCRRRWRIEQILSKKVAGPFEFILHRN